MYTDVLVPANMMLRDIQRRALTTIKKRWMWNDSQCWDQWPTFSGSFCKDISWLFLVATNRPFIIGVGNSLITSLAPDLPLQSQKSLHALGFRESIWAMQDWELMDGDRYAECETVIYQWLLKDITTMIKIYTVRMNEKYKPHVWKSRTKRNTNNINDIYSHYRSN